jgi:hypothetical protein
MKLIFALIFIALVLILIGWATASSKPESNPST